MWTIAACGLRRWPAVPADRRERSVRCGEDHLEQRVPAIQSDDYDLRYFDCTSQYVRPGQGAAGNRQFEIGHYAGYNLVGRTEVEPLPVDPDFKKTGRFWLFALYPVLAPQRARGTGISATVTPIRNEATTAGTGPPAAAAFAA